MKHTDDVSKAISLLKQTLPEMNKRNIPSTPSNYAIWYEYVTGQNENLVLAINKLDAKKAIFTAEVLRNLYDEFISDAHEAAVNKLSNSVREIIHEILTQVGKEGQGLSDYAKTLAAFSSQAEGISHIEDLKEVVLHMLSETHKREQATQIMQSSLEGMAIEMKKLRLEVAKINSEATTDSLTKVNNRRAFDAEIEALINTSNNTSETLCLVLVDIDLFSAFNKKFGHSVGDKVLRFVASLIKNNIKGGDSVARYSGKQFALLLPDTNFEGALIVAENIREKLAKQTLSDSAKKVELGTITASFGVASHAAKESAEQLINKAESALKDAKKAGRNKVVGNNQKSTSAKNIYRTVL